MRNYSKEEYIQKVIDMRLKECASTRTILKYLESEGFETTQQYQYLKWAREVIKEQFDILNPEAINEAIAQYETIMEEIRLNKDYKIWNDMNKELNKLKGLYQNKIDITTNGENINTTIINIINPNGDKL